MMISKSWQNENEPMADLPRDVDSCYYSLWGRPTTLTAASGAEGVSEHGQRAGDKSVRIMWHSAGSFQSATNQMKCRSKDKHLHQLFFRDVEALAGK